MSSPDLITHKRERKQAEVYQVLNIAPVNKSVSIQTGSGIKLSEYPFFLKGLEKVKGDDDIVKALHMLMFSSIGKKVDAKKNIRLFSGFADDSVKDEKKSKVTENKKKWTVQLLKDAMSLFGLEKGGSRNELVERLMDYLILPSIVKHDVSLAGSKKKSTSNSKTKGTKRKASTNDTAPKKKRAPTSYILFSTAKRDEIKAANLDASFAEIGALLGQKWKTLSDDEKKVWSDLAAEKAAAMKDEADDPAEGVDEEMTKANEEDDDENDDDLFGDGDALYGSGAQEEEAEKIEESNNEFDSEKLDEQPGASEDMVEEKDDDKDVEPIEEQKI